jgi:hypothetical protein
MMENKVLGRYRDQAGDDRWRARSKLLVFRSEDNTPTVAILF